MLSSISGLKETGLSKNGRMERNFLVIPIFRNLRPTIVRYTQMSVPFIPPAWNFQNILSNGKHPMTAFDRRHSIQWSIRTSLEDLDFADDLALLSHRVRDMRNKSQVLKVQGAKIGLKINAIITKLYQTWLC